VAIDAFSGLFGKNKRDNDGAQAEHVLNIDLDLLSPNPFQPRKAFDQDQLNELSHSISQKGVLQPIIVRQASDDSFEIIAGERRWRAARLAGLSSIPAIVRNCLDNELAELALIENLQREDLSYFEEADGYDRLIREFNLTQQEVAKRVGKHQSTIANKLRVLRVDPALKEQIMTGVISERHVRALLKLKTTEDQLAVLKEIYNSELNVKDTEQLIDNYIEGLVKFGNDIIDIDEAETGEDQTESKGQRITWVYSDMRIPINTIKSAVTSIQNSGVPVSFNQEMTDDEIKLTITMPRVKKQKRG
jgi:ParB family chromosome partitioning protein